MHIRKATNDDIPTLISLRIQQLDEEEPHPDIKIDQKLQTYFEEHLNVDLIQLVIEEDGKIVSTAGMMWMPFPPGFFNPIGIRGYICSVYTHPDYRHKHYATTLLQEFITVAKENNITRLFLEASIHGMPVYEKLGFTLHEAMMELHI